MAESVDRRDLPSWVVLELTRLGEQRADEGTLAGALLEALGVAPDHPVFVPAITYTKEGHRMTVHLMEGYAFLGAGLPETMFFAIERESPYVKKVLCTTDSKGIPTLSVVADAAIQDMKRRLREEVSLDIEVGMRVRINEGTYARLEGEVVGLQGEEAQVLIELRSLKGIKAIPRMFLEPLEGEEDK